MTHYRTYRVRFSIAASVAGLLLVPTYALAATTTSTSTRPDTSVRGVCLRVVSLENSFRLRLTGAGKIYAKAADQRTAKLRAQASQREIENTEARSIADAKMKEYVTALRADAGSDAAKLVAIDTFASAVTDATAIRRGATDAAQKQFVLGVQALADARSKEVAAQAVSFQNDISDAFASAKNACDTGVDPKEVRTTLHTALGVIDQKYKAQFADQHSVNERLQGLTEARTSALIAASKAFSAALDSASQALKSVLQ